MVSQLEKINVELLLQITEQKTRSFNYCCRLHGVRGYTLTVMG